jgi:hypothetical protein
LLEKGKEPMVTRTQAKSAKDELIKQLWGKPEITGIGLTPDEEEGYAVSVHLSEPLPDDAIPSEVLGVNVRVQVVGRVRAS